MCFRWVFFFVCSRDRLKICTFFSLSRSTLKLLILHSPARVTLICGHNHTNTSISASTLSQWNAEQKIVSLEILTPFLDTNNWQLCFFFRWKFSKFQEWHCVVRDFRKHNTFHRRKSTSQINVVCSICLWNHLTHKHTQTEKKRHRYRHAGVAAFVFFAFLWTKMFACVSVWFGFLFSSSSTWPRRDEK